MVPTSDLSMEVFMQLSAGPIRHYRPSAVSVCVDIMANRPCGVGFRVDQPPLLIVTTDIVQSVCVELLTWIYQCITIKIKIKIKIN